MFRSDRVQTITRGAFCALFVLSSLNGCADSDLKDDAQSEDVSDVEDPASAQAALVLDGEIIDVKSFDADPVGVYTLARVRVVKALKGTRENEEIMVQVRGGQIGDMVTRTSHQPVLRKGELARFYLEPLFEADADSLAASQDAQDWSDQTTVYGVRDGEKGKVGISGYAKNGVSVSEQALVRGCTAADGYCFGITTNPFDFGNKVYHYSVNANTSDTGGVIPAVQMGFNAWEAEPASRVDFVYDGTTTLTTRADDGTNAVFWSSTLLDAKTAAQTSVRLLGDRVVGFDMVFNDTLKWGIFSDMLIEHTAMHEAGHALGFDHVDDKGQVLYPIYQPTVTLGTGDRKGVREWYRGPELAAVGDFNGDSLDDIITFVNGTSNGDAWVALQSGGRFGASSVWRSGIYFPGSTPLVGKFNSDNKDDFALVLPSGSTQVVVVCTSNGSTFDSCAFWHASFPDAATVKAGDANGDGKDDLIAFTQGVAGTVYVALSNGSNGFGTPTVWVNAWFALGAEVPDVGDIDGDGDDDLVTYGNGASNNSIWVAKSNRSSFDAATAAVGTACFSGMKPLVGDFTGDGRADLGCVSAGDLPVFYAAPNFNTSTAPFAFLPWRNRTVYVGRFPRAGSVLSFDHCTGADVTVWSRNTNGTYAAPTVWHDFFAPGPCP